MLYTYKNNEANENSSLGRIFTMPADIKGKTSIVRKVPYDVLHRSRTVKVADSETQITQGTPHNCNLPTLTLARPLPLGSFWGSGSGGQQYSETTDSDDSSDFISRLSAYLKLKNEIYKTELGNMEEALTKAEETTKHLKGMITNLGHMVDALEGTLSTVCKSTKLFTSFVTFS